jgi:23S rRNA (guanine2445-N2)-methyltransferase / 23S rRNA (guanine2069-N7)-methyltransferase
VSQNLEFFVRCASGFESILVQELKDMRIRRVRPLKGGVAFFGVLSDAYRVCLWSRVASRVLLILDRIDACDADTLYRGVSDLAWETHVGPQATIAVYAHGLNDNLRNTQFTAVKVKDAVCDRLRKLRGTRPDVSGKRPDVLIDVSIRAQRATIALDLSGEPLHRRAYREEGRQSVAPLKENLAAAIVLDSGWGSLANEKRVFFDPMCGSGTLAIEAALIAADAAPGILRDYWGFSGWAQHDEELWLSLIDEADERFALGIEKMPLIFGSDYDEQCIRLSEENARRAGLGGRIQFKTLEASDAARLMSEHTQGLMVVNPPYGERLGSANQLPEVYRSLSDAANKLPDSWQLSIITPDDSIDAFIGIKPIRVSPFYNGRIETSLRHYTLARDQRVYVELHDSGKDASAPLAVLEENSEQFAARLRKMLKLRRKWAKRQGIACYRVYDADLPDYAAAIDVYEDDTSGNTETYVVVSEYRAPKTIDAERAKRRLADIMTITPELVGVLPQHVFLKTRMREKGGGQYRDAGQSSFVVHTKESGYTFELDLASHLDTGIFLDHRLTRELVGSMAEGKKVLNLFAYTGTASVHAAGGKALSTTTVDLSQTYLAWAKRNMEANGFVGPEHRFVRADVIPWLDEQIAQGITYDLVFVDPPTFSNSKSMSDESWSVERDHVALLDRVHRVLSPQGRALFSCNLRGFKPDSEALAGAGVMLEDISAQTIPEDFSRNPKIHKCYRFEKL